MFCGAEVTTFCAESVTVTVTGHTPSGRDWSTALLSGSVHEPSALTVAASGVPLTLTITVTPTFVLSPDVPLKLPLLCASSALRMPSPNGVFSVGIGNVTFDVKPTTSLVSLLPARSVSVTLIAWLESPNASSTLEGNCTLQLPFTSTEPV